MKAVLSKMQSVCRRITAAALAAGMLLASACGKNVIEKSAKAEHLSEGIEAQRVERVALDRDFTLANADFAMNLFKCDIERGKNVLVSPVSVLFALEMTANGAAGETLAGMQNTLAGGMDIARMNAYLYSYLEKTKQDKNCAVNIANSIWLRADGSFKPSAAFLQNNADYYGADIYTSPFNSQTVKAINDWVNEKTRGMIDSIISELPPDEMMALINAITFEADWMQKYDEYQVSDSDFTSYDGTKKNTEFMHSSEYTYLETDGAVGFIKPYEGGNYGFVALLPDEELDLYDFIASLSGEKLVGLLENAASCEVYASLPKFSYNNELSLKNVLSKLGMEKAFSPSADFSKITDGQNSIFIGEVKHKTFIEVAEKGTRAGAVTFVAMCGSAVPVEEPKSVRLDRPFVYMIVDLETNIPLFVGAVTNID